MIRRSSDRPQNRPSPGPAPRRPVPAPAPAPPPERIPKIVRVAASCGHEVEARDDTPESRVQVIRGRPCAACRVAANQAHNDEVAAKAAEARREKALKGYPVRGEEFMHLPAGTRLYAIKTADGWDAVFTMPDRAEHRGQQRGLHYALVAAAKRYYAAIVQRRLAEKAQAEKAGGPEDARGEAVA